MKDLMKDAMEERKKKALAITIVIPTEKDEMDDDLEDDKEEKEIDQPPALDDSKEKEEYIAKDKADLLRKKKDGIKPRGLDEKAMMGMLEG